MIVKSAKHRDESGPELSQELGKRYEKSVTYGHAPSDRIRFFLEF